MKKTVEILREMQYQRLHTTPIFRRMQRLANLARIDLANVSKGLRTFATALSIINGDKR